jgi:type IV secretion system protein VirD4
MSLVKVADDRGGRLENRVNLLLDEFGNFTKIPDFATKLTVGGGRGIRFSLFIQAFAQLDETYNKEVAQAIKSNCETWIYLQADDIGTLEEISKKLANYTVSTYSLSSSHDKYTTPSSSHSTNLTHRALLTTDEVKLISRPYALITSRTHPSMMNIPDLSKWNFNKLFGLGGKEHNRKIRAYREGQRPERESESSIDLWNVWEFHKDQVKSTKTLPTKRKEEVKYSQMGGNL